MNKLSTDARAEIVTLLVEGNSIRSISRLTGRSQNTIMKLVLDLGAVCVRFHDATVRNVRAKRIECDEVWSYIGCKEANVRKATRPESIGDVWTWVALEAESKLVLSWLVGDRDFENAVMFMRDLAGRLANRVQLTTDALWSYRKAVEAAFGWNGVDYAVLQKIYGRPTSDESRYSPPVCIGTRKEWIMGKPVEALVSTSYIERSNLTLRMRCRRFTRLTNAFSKNLDNHAAAVAIHYCHYNFCRIHQSVKGTPAMAAKVTPHKWSVRELVSLLDLQQAAA